MAILTRLSLGLSSCFFEFAYSMRGFILTIYFSINVNGQIGDYIFISSIRIDQVNYSSILIYTN